MYEDDIKKVDEWFSKHTEYYGTNHEGDEYTISWINKLELLEQIDIDSDGETGYYGDTWKFIDTINNMPVRSDLISRCELFNRLATIPAPPEANDFKAEIYKVIQSMEAK